MITYLVEVKVGTVIYNKTIKNNIIVYYLSQYLYLQFLF